MKVAFIHQHQIGDTIYPAGSIAEIPDDLTLIDGGICRYIGGNARHWDHWTDIVQSAASINPAGAVAAAVIDDTETGWPGTLLFSGTQDNMLAGQWQLGHDWHEGTRIKPHIHWMLTADSANAVTWQFYYRISGIGQAAGDWVGPVAGVAEVSTGGVANRQGLTTFGEIDMTGHTVSAIVAWRLYRRGSSDANGGAARVLSIDAHFRRDGAGSYFEYVKEAT